MNKKTLVNFIDIMAFIILILVGVFYLYKISYGANSFIMENFVFPLVSSFFVFLTGIRTGFAIYKARDNKIVGLLGRLLYGKEKKVTPRVKTFNIKDDREDDVEILNTSQNISKSQEKQQVGPDDKQIEEELEDDKIPVLEKFESREEEISVEKKRTKKSSVDKEEKEEEASEFIINKRDYF